MFTSTITPASAKAEATLGTDTGLMERFTVDPILCCPAIAAAALIAKAAGAAGAEAAASDSDDSGDTAVLQSTYAIAYIAPGRLIPSTAVVSENASVEELIGAQRV